MAHEHKVVTRRTVAKGAAWSVPVIALGAGAAQAAASGGGCDQDSCIVAGLPTVTLGGFPLLSIGVDEGVRLLGAMTFLAGIKNTCAAGLISAAVIASASAVGYDANGTSYTPGLTLSIGATAGANDVLGTDLLNYNLVSPIAVVATWSGSGLLGGTAVNNSIRKVSLNLLLTLTITIGGQQQTVDGCPLQLSWTTGEGASVAGLAGIFPVGLPTP